GDAGNFPTREACRCGKYSASPLTRIPAKGRGEVRAPRLRGDDSCYCCGTVHHDFAVSPSRNLKRWIFPVAVFGKLSTTSIQRGYFHGPVFCFEFFFSASWRPVVV